MYIWRCCMIERVNRNLKKIRCYHTINNLEVILNNASENELSYLSFLDDLLKPIKLLSQGLYCEADVKMVLLADAFLLIG